jgi:hypothetical protein
MCAANNDTKVLEYQCPCRSASGFLRSSNYGDRKAIPLRLGLLAQILSSHPMDIIQHAPMLSMINDVTVRDILQQENAGGSKQNAPRIVARTAKR